MAKDIFGGLTGLVKGLSNLMPQDDPDVKVFNAENELSDLRKQQDEIYAEIGRRAYAENPNGCPEADRLKLLQANIEAINNKLDELRQAREAATAEEQANCCPGCGAYNEEGVKFCCECGAAMTQMKVFCTSCGAELAPGTRFCGSCGTKQQQ